MGWAAMHNRVSIKTLKNKKRVHFYDDEFRKKPKQHNLFCNKLDIIEFCRFFVFQISGALWLYILTNMVMQNII